MSKLRPMPRTRKLATRLAAAVPLLEQRAAASVAERIARACTVIHEPKRADCLTVLLFNALRFREDIEVLAETGALRLIEAPLDVVQEVNGLYRTIPPTADSDGYDYFLERDPSCLAERRRQLRFFRLVAQDLCQRLRIDCALSPAVHYRNQFPWAAAFDGAGTPFVALHKEFTVIDERHLEERIKRYRDIEFRFPGSLVFVTNKSAFTLFSEGGVFDSDRITITGLPRMDRLFRADSPLRRKQSSSKQVTLFSFAHFCGGLGITKERRSKLFSKNDDEGFVTLFQDVHGAIAELAVARPDVTFKIKPKSVADWWIAEIDAITRQTVGRGLDDLPNCSVSSETAPELIRDSDAVIGFNSTVLLESLALGRPTIMPLFGEATEKYPYNVYLYDHVDAFIQAGSRADLKTKIEDAIAGRTTDTKLSAARREACFAYYLGYSDGRSAERVVDGLREVVAQYRSPGRQTAGEATRVETLNSEAA